MTRGRSPSRPRASRGREGAGARGSALRAASALTRAEAGRIREAARTSGGTGAAASAKTFRAADWSAWTVQELAVGSVPWARGPRCLLFQSGTAVRRVWHYPADWRALSDAALETLSWEH